ncbi:probable NAD(P)H dehydrogenase subunit CRR3, chloroplastic [Cornus florida]|uniref:probable NAD(P)H dehydrogenase subunit CRR3, chloroplastic n=1 Tax=Cornus florida TaxID=4283 RepID=UPI0028A1A271|nr:probable NAD(P)H dehydrogenase subunit CRR3, chloroplastic [Cornus florida]
MACLNCLSSTKALVFASLPNNPRPQTKRTPPVRRIKTSTTPPPTIQQQKQPSVAEIERAIGTGVFRDRDTDDRDSKQSETLFDAILSNTIGKTEGPAEKKLRETGEWIIDKSESVTHSAGKRILVVVFQWILPMWLLAFLVASGIVKLPFSTPFLDDLIM